MRPSAFCIRTRQLDNIRQSVRRALTALEINPTCPPTLIESKISGEPTISIQVAGHELLIAPAIPGSLLNHDVKVCVKPPGGLQNPGTKLTWAATSRENVLPPSGALDTHYTCHDQLPMPAAGRFYRHHFARILWISHSHPDQQPAGIKRLKELWSALYASPVAQLPELFHCLSSNVYTTKPTNITRASSRVSPTKREARSHALDLDPLKYRIAMISKADYIFSDDIGVAADAVALSKPFSFSNKPQPSYADIQSAFDGYLEHGDRIRLADEQQYTLAEQLNNAEQNATIIRTEQALSQLLYSLKPLAHQTHSKQLLDENSSSVQDDYRLILSNQQPTYTNQDTSKSLHQRLIRGRRKWRKFRESPQRFVNDSQHWSLKTVKSVVR